MDNRNWLRRVEVALSGGQSRVIRGGGDRDLTIVFATEQFHTQTPNSATIRIYNPSPDTISIFKNKEFTELTLSAGYSEGAFGVIFQGNIVQTIDGHENATDTYIDIFAYEGDTGYTKSRVSKSIPAGYTPMTKVQVALDSFAQYGISFGGTNLDLSQPKFPRGIPLVGMARNIVREVALSANGLWSIQGKQIHIVDPRKEYSQGTTIDLNAATGLIGWPKQTVNGVETTSLISPVMKPFVKIKLDPSQIIQAQLNNDPARDKGAELSNQQLLAQAYAAGTYQVYSVARKGSSRTGDEFYDTAYSIGVGGELPVAAAQQGYTLAPQ